jgi:hypothetical protein
MDIIDGHGVGRPVKATLTSSSTVWMLEGIQLKARKLVPEWLGNFILCLFFHRTNTSTQVTLTGFSNCLCHNDTRKGIGKLTPTQVVILIGLGLLLAGIVLMRFAYYS